jgi:hypothetical protein
VYQNVVVQNNTANIQIQLMWIEFRDQFGNTCGGAPLVIANNLGPGQSHATNLAVPCNLANFVNTYNYIDLASGYTATVQNWIGNPPLGPTLVVNVADATIRPPFSPQAGTVATSTKFG